MARSIWLCYWLIVIDLFSNTRSLNILCNVFLIIKRGWYDLAVGIKSRYVFAALTNIMLTKAQFLLYDYILVNLIGTFFIFMNPYTIDLSFWFINLSNNFMFIIHAREILSFFMLLLQYFITDIFSLLRSLIRAI